MREDARMLQSENMGERLWNVETSSVNLLRRWLRDTPIPDDGGTSGDATQNSITRQSRRTISVEALRTKSAHHSCIANR